jgi:calcium-dependent protein kinase
VSKQAKAFVEDLLVLDPDERATAESAYRSTWLNRRQMVTVRDPNEEETEKTQQALFQYAGYSKLKKLVRFSALCSVMYEYLLGTCSELFPMLCMTKAMMVVAHKASTEDIGILKKIFVSYDTNKSGDLTYQEFVDALASSGYTDEQLKAVFEAVVSFLMLVVFVSCRPSPAIS